MSNYAGLYPPIEDKTPKVYVGKPISDPVPVRPTLVFVEKPPRFTEKIKRFFAPVTFDSSVKSIQAQPSLTPAEPSAPPSDQALEYGTPTYGLQSPATTGFNFNYFHEVCNHCDVQRLLRFGLSLAAAQSVGLVAAHFQDAGYSLADMRALFPEYSQLEQLQLNRHMIGSKWSLQELSARYCIPAIHICQSLSLTAEDLVRSRVTAEQLIKIGLPWKDLVNMGADYQFLMTVPINPQNFGHLGGTIDDVLNLNLSMEQKLKLQVQGWRTCNLAGKIRGITIANSMTVWLTLDQQVMGM